MVLLCTFIPQVYEFRDTYWCQRETGYVPHYFIIQEMGRYHRLDTIYPTINEQKTHHIFILWQSKVAMENLQICCSQFQCIFLLIFGISEFLIAMLDSGKEKGVCPPQGTSCSSKLGPPGSVLAGGLRGFLSAWSFDFVFIAKDACLQMSKWDGWSQSIWHNLTSNRQT